MHANLSPPTRSLRSDRPLSIFPLIVAVLVLAACGDDNDPPDASMDGSADGLTDASSPVSDADAGGGDASDGPGDGGRDAGVRADAGPTEIPAALADLPLNEWRAVSTNTIQDVDPCPASRCVWSSAVEGLSGVVNDWTGGAFASNHGALGGLIYWGGGHNGYYGNEVYFFDLETLAWRRLSDPTEPEIDGDLSSYAYDSTTCRWWDGAPLAIHTYDSVFYEPLRDRFWLSHVLDFGGALSLGSMRLDLQPACSSLYPAGFDLETGTWESGAAESLNNMFSSTAWDASRNLMWYAYGNDVGSFDPVADEWTNYHGVFNAFGTTLDSGAAIDPGRDLFVIANFRQPEARIFVADLTDPGAPGVAVTTTGDNELERDRMGLKLGFEWAEQLGGFIAWKDGRDLFLLTPPEGDYRTEPWVWSRIAASGVTPDTPVNGPYSKFQYAPNLGIAFVASRVDGSVFAVRLAP